VNDSIVIDTYRATGSIRETAERLGTTRDQVRKVITAVKLKDHSFEESRLRQQVVDLQRALGEAEKRAVTADWIRTLISDIKAQPKPNMEWLTKPAKGAHCPGTPTLFFTDWHYGEVVQANQVGGINHYNPAIARARVSHVVDTTVELLTQRLRDAEYPGIVVPVGGDMFSGTIHDELRETNAACATKAVLECSALLAESLRRLAEAFGKVYCPFVVGNHGRLDKKPRAKGAAHESWDWMIGELTKREVADDPRITVEVSDSVDISWTVYKWRYHMTHGDSFHGGGGIQGALAPWMIGDYRKRKREAAVGRGYDYLVFGHWHQTAQYGGLIAGGSLKGYDEYAYKNNFSYEAPQQALWITHPKKGIIWWMPVYCEA
jgi:hypothetical protein